MKKKYKLRRILITLASLCAVFTLFCIPVNAASSGWTDTVITFDNELMIISNTGEIEYLYSGSSSYDSSWTVVGPSVPFFMVRLNEDFVSLQKGDVFQIESVSGGLGGWFAGYLYAYRFVLWDYENDEYIGESAWMNITEGGTGSSNYNVTWPATTITAKLSCDRVFVGLEFQAASSGNFSMNKKDIPVGYGDPNSPEAPSFSAPSDGAVNDLGSAEDNLMNDVSGGLGGFSQSLTDAYNSVTGFASGLLLISRMFTDISGSVSILMPLIFISLGLGLVSFIFNIVQSITSKASFEMKRKRGK